MRLSTDLTEGLKQGLLIGAAVLACVQLPRPGQLPSAASSARSSAPAATLRQLDFGSHSPSADARTLAQWVVNTGDNGNQWFVIIDKRHASVMLFQPGGHLEAATPALMGSAPGDDSVAGIGQRPIAEVRPEERTTPAGRFVAQPGRNAIGEDVVWVDYDAAVSMHRVRLNNPGERRLERLASPTISDNRISYGCINLPVAFFEQSLWPRLRRGGIVYVLPEIRPLAAIFPQLESSTAGLAPGTAAARPVLMN